MTEKEWRNNLHNNMERIQFVESHMAESIELERDYYAEWESLWDEFDDLWNSVNTDWGGGTWYDEHLKGD